MMSSLNKLGKYEILKPLGSGGMGSVYLARDTFIGRFVAIKTLHVEVGEELNKEEIEEFFNEAKVAGTLVHPNIVTIFDAGIEGGIPFIVMEFFDGIPLARFMEITELSTKEKLEILRKIGEAIDFAHSKGVIHRDIKPANILINNKREVKIADFGIARILSSQKLKQSVAIGTPAYIAPEQAIGDAIDQRADIFAFAVVAYELISGVAPFLGNDYNSTLYNILYAEPREPRNLREKGIDELKWKKVFERALSKRPEKRFSTTKDLVDALEEAMLVNKVMKHARAVGDDQVITRTLKVKRTKFKFYNLIKSFSSNTNSLTLGIKKIFVKLLNTRSYQIAFPIIFLFILIPLLFILLSDKKGEKREVVMPSTKEVEPAYEEKISSPSQEGLKPIPEPPKELILQIFSEPPHAKVSIDGVVRGETPLFIPYQEKSEITVRLEKSGYLPVTRKIKIDPAEGDKKIVIPLKSVDTILMSLDIVTEPEGARAIIDGKIVGVTPVRSYPLVYGTHSIVVEKEGYIPKQDKITVFKEGRQTVSFVLEPIKKVEQKKIPVEGELVELTDSVVKPKKIVGEYPTISVGFKRKGKFSVRLSFIVDENGNVKDITIEKSSGENALDSRAIQALKTWKYTPPTLEGVKVKVRMKQIFTFVIE